MLVYAPAFYACKTNMRIALAFRLPVWQSLKVKRIDRQRHKRVNRKQHIKIHDVTI